MTVKPIPESFHSVTPYLSIKGATAAIQFYKQAFNAVEMFRLPTPSGEIGHADIILEIPILCCLTRVKKAQFLALKC